MEEAAVSEHDDLVDAIWRHGSKEIIILKVQWT